MTLSGRIRNGGLELDEPVSLPDGTLVSIELTRLEAPANPKPQRRQGGQYAGQIWMADDFDDWPEDMQESLGMKP